MGLHFKLFIDYFLYYLSLSPVHTSDAPIVKTPLGWIEGFYNYSASGRKYEAFEGLPFAQPSIGSLRFEPPRRVSPWTGILQTKTRKPTCMGFNPLLGPENAVVGSEDCLYLNVYIPTHFPKKPMPTIMWLHPGPFHFKPLEQYGAKYLMDRDVIYIHTNFRLGPLGFLSTGDNIIPGNMGLKDQTMALKWISENIEAFGGDPKKVMMVGGSGGGISVHYHYLSPLSRGLFSSGMSQNGVGLSTLMQTRNPLKNAKRLAEIVDCPYDNVTKMVECLKLKPAKSLTNALFEFPTWNGFLFFSPFSVVIEKGENAFFDKSPAEILRSGDVYDVPWIASTCEGDGMFPAGVFFLNETLMQKLNDDWEDMSLTLLRLNETIPKERHSEVAERIRKYYFGSSPVTVENKHMLAKLCEDAIVKSLVAKAVKLMSKRNRSPVWLYNYDHRSTGSFSTYITGTDIDFGTTRQDEVLLVLEVPGVQDRVETPEDLAMQINMIDLWMSMAENGEPKIGEKTWPPVSPHRDNLNYLFIKGPNNFSLENDNNFGNISFWESLPDKESLL